MIMTRKDTPKSQRKQAEESILRDMRDIQKGLDKHRAQDHEDIDKDNVMNILTQFLSIKKTTKIH
jgi:hypothetical protein